MCGRKRRTNTIIGCKNYKNNAEVVQTTANQTNRKQNLIVTSVCATWELHSSLNTARLSEMKRQEAAE